MQHFQPGSFSTHLRKVAALSWEDRWLLLQVFALLGVARLALRLVELARPYRASARVGAARLAYRSRLAVLAADGIYGTIGEKVAAKGSRAWDQRVRVSTAGKLALLVQALMRSVASPPAAERGSLWTRPRAG